MIVVVESASKRKSRCFMSFVLFETRETPQCFENGKLGISGCVNSQRVSTGQNPISERVHARMAEPLRAAWHVAVRNQHRFCVLSQF